MIYVFARRLIVPALLKCKGSAFIAVLLLIITTISSTLLIEIGRATISLVRSGRDDVYRGGIAAFVGGDTQYDVLLRLSIIGLLLPTITWIGMYYRDIAFERVALSVTKSVRISLFEHFIKLPYIKLVELESGIAIKRIINDTDQVRTLVIEAGLRRIADIFMVFCIIIYMAYLSIYLAILSVVTIIAFFIIAYWSAGLAQGRLRARDTSRDRLSARTSEALTRLLDIRASSKEAWEVDKFSSLAHSDENVSLDCVRWLLLDRSITGYIRSISPIAILLIGSWAVLSGYVTIENLIVIIAATSMLYGPIDALSAVPITLRHVEVSAGNIIKIFDLQTEEYLHGMKYLSNNISLSEIESQSSIISIRNVQFGYDSDRPNLIIDSLDISKGDRIILVGPSGSGKSTFVRLLFGMLPNYTGNIYFNNKNINNINIDEIRNNISYMSQESSLFNGTIRDNVAYGSERPDLVSNNDVIRALEIAGMSNDILSMPNGIETNIDSIGLNISTGQKRRIGLARAILRKPSLLILDEPFSNISPLERRSVAKAIMNIDSKVGILIISHDYEFIDSEYKLLMLEQCSEYKNQFALVEKQNSRDKIS